MSNKDIVLFNKIECGRLALGDYPDTFMLLSIDQDGDKKWKMVGTAFPLFHGNFINLVTAGHVVEGLSGFPLYVFNPREGKMISLVNSRVGFSSDLDLAIIQCSSKDLFDLSDTYSCVKIDYQCKSSQESGIDSLYQVYGYPGSKNKLSLSQGFNSHAFRISLGQFRLSPSKSRLAALGMPLLCFDLSPDHLVDDDGKKTSQLGKFEGMSGGPVIKYSSSSPLGMLAGMFVEWHRVEKTAVVIPISIITTWIDMKFS